MIFKFDYKVITLLVLIFFQVFIFFYYIYVSQRWENEQNKMPTPIKFVSYDKFNRLDLAKYKNYYNTEIDEEIYLKTDFVHEFFQLINDTLCFKPGTDISHMKRDTHDIDSKCDCLPGYHGNDCSFPEVIWRGFIALRQNTVVTKQNKLTRRVIYMIHIEHPAQIQTAIITMTELMHLVDLFVVSEANATSDSRPFFFQQKLNKGTLKEYQHKILYSPLYQDKSSSGVHKRDEYVDITFKKVMKLVKNLNEDDLVISLDSNIIPNPKAVLFFKLYSGYSLPVTLRLKWNVYGYFYQHRQRTTSRVNVYTVSQFSGVRSQSASLVIGDLNHYGGWWCDLCYDPNDLLSVLQTFKNDSQLLENRHPIDVTYLEELIGDGIYIDGKTTLFTVNANEPNFCPTAILNNTWKYDSFITNFYNKVYN